MESTGHRETLYRQFEQFIAERRVLDAYDLWQKYPGEFQSCIQDDQNRKIMMDQIKAERNTLHWTFTKIGVKEQDCWKLYEEEKSTNDLCKISHSVPASQNHFKASDANAIRVKTEVHGELLLLESLTVLRDVELMPKLIDLVTMVTNQTCSVRAAEFETSTFNFDFDVKVNSWHPSLLTTRQVKMNVSFYDCRNTHDALVVIYEFKPEKGTRSCYDPELVSFVFKTDARHLTILINKKDNSLFPRAGTEMYVIQKMMAFVHLFVITTRKLHMADFNMQDTISRTWINNIKNNQKSDSSGNSRFYTWLTSLNI